MRIDNITSNELDEYIERCEILMDCFRELLHRANHAAYMLSDDSEGIGEIVEYIEQLFQDARSMRKDLRMVSFGTIEMSDSEIRGYFRKIEDLEDESDFVREDVIREAKKVLTVL